MSSLIDPESKLLGLPQSDLVLRVYRSSPDQAAQSLRLPEAKCTIGADPTCTIATAHALHPVHCLILRGPRGAVVRRWSPDTLLNGAAFDDAPLHAGDQLRLGDDVVEVLDLGIAATPNKETSAQTTLPPDAPHQTTDNAALAHLRVARDIARRRSRTLLTALRNATDALCEQQILAESATRVSNTSQDHSRQLEDTLRKQDHDFTECRILLHALQEELQRKHEAWDAEREEIRHPRIEQELTFQIQTLTQKWTLSGCKLRLLQDVLLESGRFWLSKQTAEEASERSAEASAIEWKRIYEENEELRKDRKRLWQLQQTQAEEALQSQQKMQSELATIQAELKASREDAQRRERERQDLQLQCKDLCRQLDNMRCEIKAEQAQSKRLVAEVALAPQEHATPARTADDDWKRVGSEATLPHRESASTTAEEERSAEGEADEESIKVYMSQLLQRLQEDTGAAPQKREKASQAAPSSEQTPPLDAVDISHVQQPSNEVLEEPPREMPPRRQTPSIDLGAMRDLANATAHQAINKHIRQIAYSELIAKFALAATGAACTVYLILYGKGSTTVIYAGAAVTGAVALLWGMQVRQLFRGQTQATERPTRSDQVNDASESDL